MNTTLIVGCGYLGSRVARRLKSHDSNHQVIATVTSDHRRSGLAGLADGIHVLNLDHSVSSDLTFPETPYRIIYLVPPQDSGTQDLRLTSFLGSLHTSRPCHFVYVGSSAVYGDNKGAWVSEATLPAPSTDTARRRLHAESLLDQWCQHHACTRSLLRVSGIYGPGRLPIERIRKGTPIVRPDEALPSNRIHIDDLVTVCVSALNRRGHNDIFNVSDGHPSSTTEFILAVARKSGLSVPDFADFKTVLASSSPKGRVYLSESRRLDNRALIDTLQINLIYPTVEAALEKMEVCPEDSTES